MDRKIHLRWRNVPDWLTAIFAFALLSFMVVSGRNANRPVTWSPLQPELLFILALLLGCYLLDKAPRVWRPFPYIGIALAAGGFAVWMLEINWGKWLLCAGMGFVMAAVLPMLWTRYRALSFFVLLAATMCIGVSITASVAIPRPPWQLVLVLGLALAGGLAFCLAFRPARTFAHENVSPPSPAGLPANIPRRRLYILILVALSIPSIFTGAAYKWFFDSAGPQAVFGTLMFCLGIFFVGVSARFMRVNSLLMLWMGCVVFSKALLLVIHTDTFGAHSISLFLMGLFVTAFLCLPMILWPESNSALLICSGLCYAIFFLIVIPRTLILFLPKDWLFNSGAGWTVQTLTMLYQFLLFCLFGYYLFARRTIPTLVPEAPRPGVLPTLPDSLTEREKEIAHLMLEGKTRKQIAAQLHIAENTVKTHMRNLFDKTGCHSKVAFITHYLGQPT